MKCILIIGHSGLPPLDGGAVNLTTAISEFEFNAPLVPLIIDRARTRIEVVHRMPEGYKHLPVKVNRAQGDFVIEMHANGAASPYATGTEVVYWKSSRNGKRLAEILVGEFHKALGLKLRRGDGLKPVGAGDRGTHLVKNTAKPCVIAEPFFITTDSDFAVACSKKDELVRAYADAIDAFADTL